VCPALWIKIHSLIKIVWKYPYIGRWEMYAQQITNGDQNKCDNYRGISHFSCIYKVLSHIISNSLTEYAEKIIGDYQYGFRMNRGTSHNVHIETNIRIGK